MSVGYVAVYEQGGNSTPTGTASATGQLTGAGGQCLTNQNSLNTEGNPIVLSGCADSAGQQWSPYTDGTLRTQGGCLDVVSAGTTSGTDVDWYPCNGTAAQDWTHQSNGELVNPSSGLCLTDPGGNTAARLDIETCTDATDQQWTLPTGSGTGTGNTVTVTGPGNQSSTVGTAASLQIKASDSGSGQTLSYSATGLPAGLSINSSTGLISGTPTAAGTSNVTVTARDGTGATGSTSFTWTVSAGGTGGSCGTTNLALNKTATSSSTESAAYPASGAVDGNTGTRWSSAFSDPQWLEVDLGSSQSICQVSLNWENAYATAFQIQTSTDNTNWTTIYSTTTGTGGNQTLNVTGTGRYIRMYGTARATQYGYSLWEFQVYAHRRRRQRHLRHGQRGAEQADHRVVAGERGLPGLGGHRRQPRHPLVERVLRPAVARGRSRLQPVHLPGGAELGGRLRDRVPDPDVHRRVRTGPRSTPPRPAPAATRR